MSKWKEYQAPLTKYDIFTVIGGVDSLNHDPSSVGLQLFEQLGSDKRQLVFFFGAGSSMSVGIPGIEQLTIEVGSLLEEPQSSQYQRILTDVGKANVEEILNRIRALKELIGDNETREYDGIVGKTQVKQLDEAVCKAIKQVIESKSGSIEPQEKFGQWLRIVHSYRELPLEIFTTNYDLLLERALERHGVPYYDGFVGSVNPFFAPESVDTMSDSDSKSSIPPSSWVRLWKIHGSLNWRMISDGETSRIARSENSGENVIIFPSRDKYEESRRLPFLTFQDRLRKVLLKGATLVVVIGYSFSDQHINDILFQGLRSNPRLSIIVPMYLQDDAEKVYPHAIEHKNLSVYGPKTACIGGKIGDWQSPAEAVNRWAKPDVFWNSTNDQFSLGDFQCFANFLDLLYSPQQNACDITLAEPLNDSVQGADDNEK